MKSKAGLHKKISSIFDGVPIPGSAASVQPGSSDPAGLTGRGGESTASGSNGTASTSSSLPVAMDNGTPARSGTVTDRSALGGRRSWFKSVSGRSTQPKGKVALVAILMVALGLVLVMVLRQPASIKANQKQTDPSKEATPVKNASAVPVWPIPEPFPVGLRDPLAIVEAPKVVEEPVVEIKKPDLFVIRGVVLGAGGNTAIVGSEIVSVGDEVLGAKVIRIDRGEVEFEKDGQRWVQTVAP